MSACPQCKNELLPQAAWCPQCGIVQPATEQIDCENHASELAIGLCVLCGKPVCGDCALSVEGKTFCENAQHQSIFRDWSVAHESDFEFESDMIRHNIAAAGIETMVFSFRNFLGTFWLKDMKPVRVLVPNAKHQQARETLMKLRLIEQQDKQ